MSKPNSKTDTAWMKFYRELGEYKTKHGHTAVSVPKVARLDRAMYNNVSEYASLAKWVSRQRIAHKSGKLHPDRFQLLEDLDFYWCPTDRTWDERYEELRRNQKVVGASVYIPSNKGQVDDNETKNKPGYSERVMQWAAQQRVQYMLHLNGNHSKMNERRIAKLERIGFQWWKDDADKATIKGKADKENYMWAMRKVPDWLWRETSQAAAKAAAESMTTDMPVPVIVNDNGSRYALQLEADKKTHVLVPVSRGHDDNTIFVIYMKGAKCHTMS